MPLLFAGLAAPLLAAAANQAPARVAGYRDLGAAFKAFNDALRSPSPQPAILQASVRKIRSAAAQQYGWFPSGSAPRPGLKTAAKPEIWSQPGRFRQSQDAFSAQAAALEPAVASGNLAVMRTAARSLGAACKGCHDQFRFDLD
ncbi:MAG: cytochrome c [Novosphingobium sp.]